MRKISHLNIGCGKDISISELAEIISRIVHFKGKIKYDTSKPNGTPRKLLDVTKLSELGWNYSTDLEQGIQKTYKWFLNNQ